MPDMTQLLPHVPIFLLVLFRMAGIFVYAPMLGSLAIPIRIRVLLALALSVAVYPLLGVQQAVPLSLMTLPMLIGAEMLVGLVIGYIAQLPFMAVQMGAMVMSQQLGLSFAQVVDPDTDDETSVFGQILYLMVLAIFLVLNGHQAIVELLVHSFDRVPLGGFVMNEPILIMITGILDTMFELALRIAAPMLCLLFVQMMAMGFLARTVPQLNILSLGFPLRVLVGMFITIASLVVIQENWSQAFGDVLTQLWQWLGA